jgi:hypothetical protein
VAIELLAVVHSVFREVQTEQDKAILLRSPAPYLEKARARLAQPPPAAEGKTADEGQALDDILPDRQLHSVFAALRRPIVRKNETLQRVGSVRYRK